MATHLSWQEIEQRYFGEWIELADYNWPEGQPHPECGTVRFHAKDRMDFFANTSVGTAAPGTLSDALVLLVGKPTKLPRLKLQRFETYRPEDAASLM